MNELSHHQTPHHWEHRRTRLTLPGVVPKMPWSSGAPDSLARRLEMSCSSAMENGGLDLFRMANVNFAGMKRFRNRSARPFLPPLQVC